jgi:hypothetical protein
MSRKFRLLMVLVLMTGLLGGLATSSTVTADPLPGNIIELPRIDVGDVFGTGDWDTQIQVQNVSDVAAGAIVFFWGCYDGLCPSNDLGLVGHACMQLPYNGVWTLHSQIPDDACSAIVYAVTAVDFQDACDEADLSSTADWKDWVAKWSSDLPLAVTVDRWGPDSYGDDYVLSSSYTGVADPGMTGVSFKYFAPYIMHKYLSKYDTTLTIQNSGDLCTSVWVYYKQEGNCECMKAQHIEVLAPGQAIRIGPGEDADLPYPAGGGYDPCSPGNGNWLGSAYISANEPLAIVVDQISHAPSANQGTFLSFRGQPYKPYIEGEWDTKWYADLLYREISGWQSSIQVQNVTQKSVPTFVTVDFMDQSGDEILFVGDWVCRNGSGTFYLPAIIDLGVNFPFGYVGAAEIESHCQVDYPGETRRGEPIFVVVDLKKTKMWDGTAWSHTGPGETQGGAYNAHPESEKEWAAGWAMPYIAKEQAGVTSRIAIRNNSNCNKIEGTIYIKDETGTVVAYIPVPWLHPKHMKVFDLGYFGQIARGFVGAAEFFVEGVEQLCDADNDGHVDNLPFMPSVVVLNYGWEYELTTPGPWPVVEGDLTRVYEGIPFAHGDKWCDADLLGIVTDDNLETVIKSATVTVFDGWWDWRLGDYVDAVGTTGPGGMYEIERIITQGTLEPWPGTCYTVRAEKTGFLCQEVLNKCLHCGEDEVLDFALICNTNTWNGTVKQYVVTPDNGAPPIEGATVTAEWGDIDGDLPCDDGVEVGTTDVFGDFSFLEELPKEVDITITISKVGYDEEQFPYTFMSPVCGETYEVTDTNSTKGDYIELDCWTEVKGQLWNDTDGDGLRDLGEPLLEGETCTLYTDGALKILGYATTDKYGICRFFVGKDVYPGDFDFVTKDDVEVGVGGMIKGVDNINPCEVHVVDFPL